MTKERLEELRKKLNDSEYINKACADIGSRLCHEWEKTGFSTTREMEISKGGLARKNRNYDDMYLEAPHKTVDELSRKYGLPTYKVRDFLHRKGITPKSWSYKNERT